MNTPWRIERWRLIGLILLILILGTLSERWLVSIIIPVCLYIGWQLTQLYRLEKWLRKGYKPGKTPDSSGVWESIISEILRLRKQDRKHKKNLAKAAKGYRNTVKALPDAAVVVNHTLEIEWANQFAEQLLGINIKRDMGQRITNLIRAPEFLDYLNHPGHRGLEIEAPGNEKATLSIRIMRYGQNQSLILGRDISEPLRSRNALRAFVSNASHELRTPLTVTSGYIDLLQSDPDLPEQCQAPLQQLREQTDQMSHLINDLLTLSQLEVRPLLPEEGLDIDVPALISQLVHTLQEAGISERHHIELKLDPNLGLSGLEREFSSIFTNLLENACKYTPAGSTISINWSLRESATPCLVVADNGPGFSAAVISDLSRRFYRINNPLTASIDGTGLGLAIVKHAVMHHGGKLEISSQQGQGAQFSACFPAFRQRTPGKNPDL